MALARVDVCRWLGEPRLGETRAAFQAAQTLMQVSEALPGLGSGRAHMGFERLLRGSGPQSRCAAADGLLSRCQAARHVRPEPACRVTGVQRVQML